MAETLSHVLHAFVILTIASWSIGWLDREWIAVAMVGAIVPDLSRIDLLLSADAIEATLGIPFSWSPIHTLGGVVVLSAVGAMLFATRQAQVRAFGLLVAGGIIHLLVDSLKLWADGVTSAYWYPLTWYNPPAGMLYVTADRWVTVVSIALAVVVLGIDEWRRRNDPHHSRNAGCDSGV